MTFKAAVALVRNEAFSDFIDTLASLIHLKCILHYFEHENLPIKNKYEEIIDLFPQMVVSDKQVIKQSYKIKSFFIYYMYKCCLSFSYYKDFGLLVMKTFSNEKFVLCSSHVGLAVKG